MIYVIGSGPAGVSAAVALVNKGIDVTMLDAGFELEPERAEVVRRLQQLDKKDWNDGLIGRIKENMHAHSGGVDLKLIYGSNYPYRGMNSYQPVQLKGSKMFRSLGRGGLSTVWGASILPFRQDDITDWPITVQDLEPHYKAVFSFMAQSAKRDALCALFPIYDKKCQAFYMCNQAFSLLQDLKKNINVLNANGIYLGYSRLAVSFDSQRNGSGCAYCGMCLYGCPYEKIYSSAYTLDRLLEEDNFSYMQGVLVEKLIEENGQVKIVARSLPDSKPLEFIGSRVFLSAGILSSSRILLQSLEIFDHALEIKHSDHFQIPMMRYRKTKNVTSEELHTLTQLYIEFMDKSISKNAVHMQVYAYNDLYAEVLNNLVGHLEPFFRRPFDEVLGRLLIIKGYLHSNISSRIKIRLEPGKNGRLIVEGLPNEKAGKALKKIVAKLIKNRKCFKAIPFPVMAKLGIPGEANHSGGSFPMKKNPSEFESDELGRPYGFEKFHVVDSSVFPSIPATTITLTAMANAHRIATEAI
jgi:choline dehydrogenase-like flavoprotein